MCIYCTCVHTKEVAVISGIVRKQLLNFFSETKMSKYRFAQKSQLPPSTLRCILKKEDYDIGERNILKICEGMGVKPYEVFLMDKDKLFVTDIKELNLVRCYRNLSDDNKLRVEGYLQALIESKDH